VEWSYQVYGLNLSSDRQIPGLQAIDRDVLHDVEIETRDPVDSLFPAAGEARLVYRSSNLDFSGLPIVEVFQSPSDSSFAFRYCDGVRFGVDRAGRRIWYQWPETLTLDDAATYLLGPILGFVLRLRSVVCLHASAVVLKAGVVAIAGTNGTGKSTSAARFASLGHRILSDDLLPLRKNGEAVMADSGYPRIRLWPDAVEHLYGPSTELPALTPTWNKRYLDVAGQFQHERLPLAAVYILGQRGSRPAAPLLEPLSSSDAFVALVSNTYCNYMLDRSMREYEFDFLSDLIDRVPIYKILPDDEPDATGRLCSLILANHC
jgi:hypothetical protein